MSLNDTAAAIKAQFPYAKIESLKRVTPAQLQHDKGNKRKLKDEMQRTLDETTHAGNMEDRDRELAGYTGTSWTLEIGQIQDPADPCYSPRLKVDKDWSKVKCAECGFSGLKHRHWADRPVWLCDECRFAAGCFHRWENDKNRKRVDASTTKALGGMELVNENLGSYMGANGHPEIVKRMRESGQLQVRRDADGHPVEVLVSKSRKQQEQQLKAWNRVQAEARSGLPESQRHRVRFLRHGGLSPD